MRDSSCKKHGKKETPIRKTCNNYGMVEELTLIICKIFV